MRLSQGRTLDALALDALLEDDAPMLDALHKIGRVMLGNECPHCGERERIEDNGARDVTYLCVACGHQWEPNTTLFGGPP